jgi:cytochrome o ubiquinol oxidase operon protein cyoD
MAVHAAAHSSDHAHGHAQDPLLHAEVRQASTGSYFAGYAASIILMLAALLVTQQHVLTYPIFLWVVSSLVVIALVAQAALFFGLGLAPAQAWKSVSLILTVPLFVFTIGLSVWMFNSLYPRTMPDSMPGMDMTQQPTLLE